MKLKVVFTIFGAVIYIILGLGSSDTSDRPPRSESKIDRVIQNALSYRGVPYKYGGENRNGIDCSALMQNSFASQGITLPRRAVWQSELGNYRTIDEIDKGDLIFFQKKGDKEISHVGLVIYGRGINASFVHSSGSIGKVAVSNISDRKWSSIFVKGQDIGY